jgi:hypothetical protein
MIRLPKATEVNMVPFFVRVLTALAVVIAYARASAQGVPASTSPRYTRADSAAVFAAAVDHIIDSDGGRPSTPPIETGRQPRRDDLPSVFVRIGSMPDAAWAAPSVARLRAWRWSYQGMAIDSSRVLTEGSEPPAPSWSETFPVELVLTLDFEGDTARVRENWIWQTCKKRPGLRATFITSHSYIRSATGWSHVGGTHPSSVADGLCPESMARR